MNYCSKSLLLFLILFSTFSFLRSQSTEDYFSQEGLSINSYHYNQFSSDISTSYSYSRKDTICNDSVLVFTRNRDGFDLFLFIDEDKVYRRVPQVNGDCFETLHYDFGLEIGEMVSEGAYQGYTIMDKYEVFLENGETRFRFDLNHNSQQATYSWIEGIGDIENGLYSNLLDFEGGDVFVCAKKDEELLWVNENEADTCDSLSLITNLATINNTSIRVFPNPTKDQLNIQSDINSQLHIQLFSIDGQLQYESNNIQSESIISMKKLEVGMYILKIGTVNSNQFQFLKVAKTD